MNFLVVILVFNYMQWNIVRYNYLNPRWVKSGAKICWFKLNKIYVYLESHSWRYAHLVLHGLWYGHSVKHDMCSGRIESRVLWLCHFYSHGLLCGHLVPHGLWFGHKVQNCLYYCRLVSHGLWYNHMSVINKYKQMLDKINLITQYETFNQTVESLIKYFNFPSPG